MVPAFSDYLAPVPAQASRGATLIGPLLQALFRCASCGLCGQYVACATYTNLLRAWHHVYRALEGAMDVAELRLPELRRRADLELDLESLAGRSWGETTEASDSALEYAGHLAELAERSPALLSAHVVARYRGDVLGGQRWGTLIADVLSLPVPEGIRFFACGSGSVARLEAAVRTLKGPLDVARARDEMDLALDAERRLYGEACLALAGHAPCSMACDLPSSS